MSQVIRPYIPYRGPVTGGLHDGKRIEITGEVPYGANLFQVNLMAGMDPQADRLLHLSVRFKGREVVRNALKQNSYGPEEKSGSFPFMQGSSFTMVIIVNSGAYRISVNGQHCWEFCHRMPYTRVSSIFIDGDVKVDRIDYINKIPPQPSAPVYTTPQTYYQQPPAGMSVATAPCIFPICGGLRKGMRITITGRPTGSPQNFIISLQNGSNPIPPPEIAFQFDARFYNYSVIRNSRNNYVWGAEETMISHFPFQPSATFSMVIKVQSDKYAVDVNGQHFISFRHRLNAFSRFNTLYISNDVIITGIKYD